MNGIARSAAASVLAALAACQTYRPEPLDPERILEQLEQRRHEAAQGEVLTLAQATELMREHGPRLREARAAQRGAQALADTPTPLPNPTLEAAPTYLDVLGGNRWGAEGALGWTVLLGGRRRLTDDVNAIRAEAALVEVVSVEREEYLALRREMALLALASREVEARRGLEETVRASLDVMRRLVEAAQATALDVRELEIEGYEAEAAVLAALEAEEEGRSALGARAGVPARAFRVEALPPLPEAVPAPGELRERMLRDRPDLARLRAEYQVAEKELRLEIARQYPSLDLGLLFEREEGVNKFGLGVGIEVPVFDRNQPAIAEARARRDEVRARFEADAARGLSAIEAARTRLEARRARLALLRGKVAPAAAEALELARRGLSSGAADALRFLSVLRVERAARIEVLEAEAAVYEAWSDLEEACGAPLLRHPGEPGEEAES